MFKLNILARDINFSYCLILGCEKAKFSSRSNFPPPAYIKYIAIHVPVVHVHQNHIAASLICDVIPRNFQNIEQIVQNIDISYVSITMEEEK